MAATPHFPNPSPAYTAIQSAIDTFDSLELLSQNGDRTVIANKRIARTALTTLFIELCSYIAFTLRNNPNAGELIESIGLEVAQQGSHTPVGTLPVPFDVQSQVSQEPGAIDLQWESLQRGVHSWVIEMADGPNVENAVFRQVATTTTKKFRATGLVRGNFYIFRIRCVGAKSAYSVASEITVCMAG